MLLISSLTAEWNPKDFQKREHSLVKPYTGMMASSVCLITLMIFQVLGLVFQIGTF